MTNDYSTITPNNIDIILNKAQYANNTDKWYLEKTKSPYSRVYFVKEANGTLSCQKKEIPFQGGYIYIIPAEMEFTGDSDYFEKIFFHVSVLSLEKYDIFANLDDIYTLPLTTEEFDMVLSLLESQNYYDKIRLKMHLLSVFVRMLDAYPIPPAAITEHSPLVEKILHYVQNHISLQLRVADISKALFVSESKIRNTFRAEMGIPIGKHMDALVFSKARDLLMRPDIPISQISAMLGFCDQFYFSRQFKEKFGHTPSEFRKMMR